MKLLAAHLALASARWASAPLSELGGVLEPFELCALRHGLTPLAAMESQWARDGGACGLSYPEILRLRGSSSPCYLAREQTGVRARLAGVVRCGGAAAKRRRRGEDRRPAAPARRARRLAARRGRSCS